MNYLLLKINISKLIPYYLGIFFIIVTSSIAQNLVYTNPYTITTIASNILNGNGYADGNGENAIFNQPSGVTVDTVGNIYIADSANNVIRKITSNGAVTTIAGKVGVSGYKDGIGLDAEFGQLYGLAIDNSNNLYVTDLTYNSVRKLVYANGLWKVSTIVSSAAGLKEPTGIAIDTNGVIYVADSGNGVIRKVDTTGSLSIFAGSIGSVGSNNGAGTNANFGYPVGIAIDPVGNLYVTDSSANMIRKITPTSIVTTVAGSYGAPGQVDGTLTSGLTSLSHPGAITCDSQGNIYFCDGNNSSVIRTLNSSGIMSSIAGTNNPGGNDGTGSVASFLNIKGITVNKAGVLYISNTGTATIRKGTPQLLNTAPNIISITGSISATLGNTYSLTAQAVGSIPILYSWYLNDALITSNTISSTYTTSTLTLKNFTSNQAGQYYVTATNSYGTSKSSVTNVAIPITILSQPQPLSIISGASFNLSVAASGTMLTYQWYLNGKAISGATLSYYSSSSSDLSNLGTYTVLVSNAIGSQISQPTTLTFLNPVIVFQPESTKATLGSDITFNIGATGLSDLYQWYFNGNVIPGANSSTLKINNVNQDNAGNYSVSVSNTYGNSRSSLASLSLITNPGRLKNLSVLSMDGPGSQLLTVGFVTGGKSTTGSQNLLIRGIGPSLGIAPFYVPNILQDPTLTIYNSTGSIVTFNDNWGSIANNVNEVTDANVATGAFALSNTSSLDAALVTRLVSGGYSVQVAGKNAMSGNVIAEVYDNTSDSLYTNATPRLINLSCLEQISSSGVLSAGFVIGGNSSIQVLIRASGPTLASAPYNVSGTIPDPKVTVYNSSSVVLAENTSWGGSTIISAANAATGAFQFLNSTSKDSAVILSLLPGAYTVQATSKSGTSGVVLIEIYEVP